MGVGTIFCVANLTGAVAAMALHETKVCPKINTGAAFLTDRLRVTAVAGVNIVVLRCWSLS